MSDLKISSLPRKAALATNDLIPIVDLQFGAPNYVNKKTTIGDLVTIVSNAVGQQLGDITSVNGQTGAVVISVSNLSDSLIQAPSNGDVLRYDAGSSKWINTVLGDYAPIVDGKIPESYLPSYVDDVLEFADFAALPALGETGKIYVALNTNKTYRWSGSTYVEISSAISSTDSVPEGVTNLYYKDSRVTSVLNAWSETVASFPNGLDSANGPIAVGADLVITPTGIEGWSRAVNFEEGSVSGDWEFYGAIKFNQPTTGISYVDLTNKPTSLEWSADTVSQSEAEAGTATTRRAWTAQRVFQAISAWWNASAAKTKLDGIAAGATANATDAQLRDRSTHTGTQAATTITGLAVVATSGSYADLTNKPAEYSLPTASDTVLGGVKIGAGVSILNGVISVSTSYVANDDVRLSDAREWSAGTVPQSEAEAGTATTRRAWTAQRVRQAFDSFWTSTSATLQLSWSALTNVPSSISTVAAIPDFNQYITNVKSTSQTFTVKGVDQGIYSDNTEIPQGTALETIIKNMLQKVVAAVYRQPTFSISSTPAAAVYEYGALLTPALLLSWDKRDAGNATVFRMFKNNALISAATVTGSAPGSGYTDAQFALTATTSYYGQVDHGAGPQLLDNMGNPSGTPIAAATRNSNTITFTPRHKRYWGCSANDTLISDNILNLPTSDSPLSGSEFATSLAMTKSFNPDNEYIYFAWSAELGDASSFVVNNLPTSGWVKTTVSFTNASGYTSNYAVYRSPNKTTGTGVQVQVS